MSESCLAKVFIAWIALSSSGGVGAEKLNLSCGAAEFQVKAEFTSSKEKEKEIETLGEGFVRSISPPMAGFFNTKTYSDRTSYECEEKNLANGETIEKCIGLNNGIFCKNPQSHFSLIGIRDDNSVVMVSNRCDGAFRKYARIDNQDGEDIILVDEKFRYQLKHQHIAGTATQKQPPVLRLIKSGSSYDIWIESFRSDHWKEDDPGAAGTESSLMMSIDAYTGDLSEQYSVKTSCDTLGH